MAASCPCILQRSLNGSLAVTPASRRSVSDHVLQNAVAPSLTKKVRCSNEHAGRGDAITIIGYENMDAKLFQDFLPDTLGMVASLGHCAYLRHFKEGA